LRRATRKSTTCSHEDPWVFFRAAVAIPTVYRMGQAETCPENIHTAIMRRDRVFGVVWAGDRSGDGSMDSDKAPYRLGHDPMQAGPSSCCRTYLSTRTPVKHNLVRVPSPELRPVASSKGKRRSHPHQHLLGPRNPVACLFCDLMRLDGAQYFLTVTDLVKGIAAYYLIPVNPPSKYHRSQLQSYRLRQAKKRAKSQSKKR
jgi:hypothetical protein